MTSESVTSVTAGHTLPSKSESFRCYNSSVVPHRNPIRLAAMAASSPPASASPSPGRWSAEARRQAAAAARAAAAPPGRHAARLSSTICGHNFTSFSVSEFTNQGPQRPARTGKPLSANVVILCSLAGTSDYLGRDIVSIS